ncbi:hypothetical protein GCM10023339_40600 [Alloalcanivorax gelatiniphagus]
MKWYRWQDWVNVVLGAYAMCVPLFTVNSNNNSTIWSAEIFGLLIICVGFWALAQPASKAAEWTQVLVGVLFALAPFMFDYAQLDGAAINAYSVGALVALLAAWGVVEASRESETTGSSSRHHVS